MPDLARWRNSALYRRPNPDRSKQRKLRKSSVPSVFSCSFFKFRFLASALFVCALDPRLSTSLFVPIFNFHFASSRLCCSLYLFHQCPQHRQIFHIFMKILRFRRLKAAGDITESCVVDEMTKTFAPDLSLPDVRVAIHLRAQIRFGIVEMKRQ